MTSKNDPDAHEEDSLGVLDEATSLDTTALGVLGQTAQVSVSLSHTEDDDDLGDDSVVDGEIPSELTGIIIELSADAAADGESASADGESASADGTDDAEPESSAENGGPEAIDESEQADEAGTDEVEIEAEAEVDEPEAEVEVTEDIEETEDVVVGVIEVAPDDDSDVHEQDAAVDALDAEDLSDPVESDPVDEPEAAVADAPRERPVEVVPASRRVGDQIGQASRETADLLTSDRLLNPSPLTRPEPEGTWSHLLYTVSGRRINIGDGKRARTRKALTARISSPLAGGAQFVPVLSRKGGVGKTTITILLGMALADARDDRVIAVDANPDRGTLADRIVRSNDKSVRDLVRIRDDVKGYHDISAIVARDSTRLDVLASDSDPRVAEAFGDQDYRDVADVAAHYYSLVLTDTGTGIVHSVMGATLDLADQIVIVSGLSVDEARLASETLTWLEANGYEAQARNAIIVLNQSTSGSPLVRLNELEAHFRTRARSVVRMPYDRQIAGGGAIVFANLQPETRQAARELAALLVEGLRAPRRIA